MNKEQHVHDWKPTSKTIPLHNYVTEGGKIIKDLITGKDTLKQLKCKCGQTTTYDLERKRA